MPGDLRAKRGQDEVQSGSTQQDGPPALFEDFVSVLVPRNFVLMAFREAVEPLPPHFLMTGAWVGQSRSKVPSSGPRTPWAGGLPSLLPAPSSQPARMHHAYRLQEGGREGGRREEGGR